MDIKKNIIFCSALLIAAFCVTPGECDSGTGWVQNRNDALATCLDVDDSGNKFQCGNFTIDKPGPGNCSCSPESKTAHAGKIDKLDELHAGHA